MPLFSLQQQSLRKQPQLNKETHKRYAHIGAKGGSTLFVLNNAMYLENLEGDQYEVVLLFDDLKFHENFRLSLNWNTFESNLIRDADYRDKVREALLN